MKFAQKVFTDRDEITAWLESLGEIEQFAIATFKEPPRNRTCVLVVAMYTPPQKYYEWAVAVDVTGGEA
jgi:hypothetical protein